jgi:uncharacterized protein YfaS (alpha-2-macroglobulin family)
MEVTRLTFSRLLGAALLIGAFPTVAQLDEGRVFFSLSSDRTYGPGDTPRINMWGQGIAKLDFRLYRVNDPVEFFRGLQDDHRFGGRMPQSRNLSRIERFRRWKLATRRRLQTLGRAQFTADSRKHIRSNYMAKQETPAQPAVTNYAELPVLNPQQLVSSWTQPFNPRNRWESLTVPVPVRGKGLYLVEATNGPLFAYTIISVTEMAIITKSSPGRVLARVVDRKTGAPLARTPVVVFAANKESKYADGVTGSDGFIEARVTDERPDSALVVASVKDDFAAVSMYGGNLGAGGDNLMAYVYTDRPVYRPGHKVHFRAVLRQRTPSGYRVPPGSVSVEVQDSEGKQVHRSAPGLSAFGTLDGSFDLPDTASLGFYTVQVHLGDLFQSGSFRVEEYRKPEYDVRVTPSARRVLQGAEFSAEIEAKYFYGDPVAGAKVKYVAHRSRHWNWSRDDDEGDEAVPDDSPFAHREQVLEREGKLDENGKLTVSIPTDRAEFDLSYRIEARVTDAAGREIAGAGFGVATVGPFRIDIQPERYVYEPGQLASFRVVARDYDGNAVPNVAVRVELGPYSWERRVHEVTERAQAVTGADGSARVSIRVPAGSLRAVAKVLTPDGRTITDLTYVWVSGGNSWWAGGGRDIRMVADKKSYKPGETARILIAAQPGMHLWITAEGAAVHTSQFAAATGPTVMIDVPIAGSYAPNFYVNAVAIMDHEIWTGSLSVKVPPAEHRLDVGLTASKKEFKPGEPAVYSLLAKDWKGAPVQAEFSVGVVDEAVYSVEPDQVRDPVSFFYGREWNRVGTESSLHYSFHGEAGRRRMQLARVRPFTPRAQLKPERLVQPKVRKAFPDTAFWSAVVRTDAAGRATVKLSFPDALTTWRATARGVTSTTKLGSALHRVIVRKNLMTRLSVPRFFRQGDEMTVSVIAQNYLPSDKRVRLSLEAKGLDLVQAAPQDVLVPSKGVSAVDYRVRVPASKEAVLLASALTDEESDALELTLPVIPFGVRMGIAKAGALSSNGEASIDITFPNDADASSRTIDISASPTVAGTLFDALDYLTSFPYGCTEQTMSSFLPNVVVSRALKSLDLKNRVDERVLAKKIRAGLDRLYDFQHDDGGWGWWKEDESDYFMTAYVLAGLAQARDAGEQVDQERIRRALQWLERSPWRGRAHNDRKAYAAYASALAGRPDTRLVDSLYSERRNLNAYSLIALGLALDRANDARAPELAGLVESRAKISEAEAWWDAERDYCLDILEDASPEATAFALKLLSSQRPSSPLLPKAAFWLVNHRRSGYYWNSTKQTAMVIHGLTGYMKLSGELKPDIAFLVYVNDRQVLSRKFTPGDPLAPASIRLSAGELAIGRNTIRIVRSGEGRLYWSANGGYYSTSNGLSAQGGLDLSIGRQYFRLVANRTSGRIVHDLEPFDGNARQGDVIAVKLDVRGRDARYLLVEDPIPAGTEIVTRDDLYEFRQKPEWWSYFFTRREFRDDRAVFFHSYLLRASTPDYYLLKVVNPGKFRVSPARVEPMYQPQYFAASDGSRWEVTK